MAAFYDSYDYPTYWEGRRYEHEAEIIALNDLLGKIPKIKNILEIGAGYGRLTKYYFHRAEKIILTDPSARLLKIARSKFRNKKIKFIQIRLENINTKIRNNSVDMVILIRVIHHLEDLNKSFKLINNLLKKNGYFILEFANKKHLKAQVSEFIKGNITFAHDIFPKELGGHDYGEAGIPFINYHPDQIDTLLKENGFEVIKSISVSNIRSPFLKKHLPLELLLSFEKYLQVIFSKFNLGPSIFILAKKST